MECVCAFNAPGNLDEGWKDHEQIQILHIYTRRMYIRYTRSRRTSLVYLVREPSGKKVSCKQIFFWTNIHFICLISSFFDLKKKTFCKTYRPQHWAQSTGESLDKDFLPTNSRRKCTRNFLQKSYIAAVEFNSEFSCVCVCCRQLILSSWCCMQSI